MRKNANVTEAMDIDALEVNPATDKIVSADTKAGKVRVYRERPAQVGDLIHATHTRRLDDGMRPVPCTGPMRYQGSGVWANEFGESIPARDVRPDRSQGGSRPFTRPSGYLGGKAI